MDLNNRNITNHPPSPRVKQLILMAKAHGIQGDAARWIRN